jgi:hypothetical protein
MGRALDNAMLAAGQKDAAASMLNGAQLKLKLIPHCRGCN